jgi:hypothetical protein
VLRYAHLSLGSLPLGSGGLRRFPGERGLPLLALGPYTRFNTGSEYGLRLGVPSLSLSLRHSVDSVPRSPPCFPPFPARNYLPTLPEGSIAATSPDITLGLWLWPWL